MDQQCEEHSFLCGSQRIRRYGSLNESTLYQPKHKRIIIHKVLPSDTLQALELCYKSSMYEIKRINRLWSDQSLHCKSEVLIPIFHDDCLPTQAWNVKIEGIKDKNNDEDHNEETVDQLFRRIDLGVKQTKRTVKKLTKKRIHTLKETGGDC